MNTKTAGQSSGAGGKVGRLASVHVGWMSAHSGCSGAGDKANREAPGTSLREALKG